MEKNIEEIVGFLSQQYERLKNSINFVNDDGSRIMGLGKDSRENATAPCSLTAIKSL